MRQFLRFVEVTLNISVGAFQPDEFRREREVQEGCGFIFCIALVHFSTR